MSESTIDRLSIEITSNSTGAKQSIDDIAKALGALKTNGGVGTAVSNLERLGKALKGMNTVVDKSKTITRMASAMSALSKVGSTTKAINALKNLPAALQGLDGVKFGIGTAMKIKALASSLSSLSGLKGGGISSIARALEKLKSIDLDEITFDDASITRFVTQIKKLDDEIGPLSEKMLAVSNAVKVLDKNARTAGSGVKAFGSGINTTTLNLASMITVIRGVVSAIMPFVRLLSDCIKQAMEWDSIAYQFGTAFGEQADEYYEKITKITDALSINKQAFMENTAMAASMLIGFGVSASDAREMGLGYTELAYDIWAAYNNVYKSVDEATTAVRSAISGEVEPIRRAGFTIVDSQLAMTAANHGIAYSSQTATEELKSYLRYLTLMEQAHNKGIIGAYADEMSTAEGLTRTLAQQVRSLAQSFGSLFLPMLVKILPWIQALVTLLTEAIVAIARFFGIAIQPAKWSGGAGGGGVGALNDSLDETASSAGSAKKAIEDLKNATLGIDELNVISPPKDNAGGGGGGGAGGGGGSFDDFEITTPWDQIQFEADEIKRKLEEALMHITAIVSGFMLAIGTILVVSGANIPLGLALMAVGAVGLVAVIAENWNGMSDRLAKTLTIITATLGGFLLAIGAFLAFSGVNVGLGAALMVAGATSLATAVAINWKFLNGDLKNTLSILTGIVAGGLLAMGALFAFTGVDVPLGIALMVAGAVGLVTAIGLNWNFLSEPMRKAIGALEAVVGGGLLALGAIMAFSGANLPLGIALMAAGAVSLVAATALNWKSLSGNLKNTIATITAIVSGALLGVGAVLAFCGVSMPLGISLMAAGAVGLVASAPVNWKSLTGIVKTVLKEIGAAVGVSMLAVGAVLAFSGVSMPIGISLMAAGAVSLISSVALNWSAITSKIKAVLKEIGIIAGGSLLALGVILCLTGVAMPLGVALIAAGAAGLASGIAFNWDSLLGKLKKTWSKIEGWWNEVKKLDPVDIGVSLVKKGWKTFTGWLGKIPGVSQAVSLVKNGWTTVEKWIGKIPTLSQAISLIKSGWTTVKNWIGNIPVLSQAIKLVRSGWTTIRSWIGNIPTLSQAIKLVRSGWTSIKSWIGKIPTLSQAIKLVRSGWTSVKSWVGNIPTLSAGIKLVKSGWTSVKNWLGDLNFKLKFKLPKIGIEWGKRTVAGFTIKFPERFYTYAKGGFPDLGEMFIAREAGPEMVGRIGSKSAVANNDQIVEGISEGVYRAVLAAMRASENGENRNINVYLDGKQITSSVEKHQKERGASLMGRQVYA